VYRDGRLELPVMGEPLGPNDKVVFGGDIVALNTLTHMD
jgi:hypothetical protein